MAFNILTCSGFEGAGGGFLASVPCIKARVGLVILFFLIAIIRKWGGEELGVDFSLPFALVLGLGGYFLMITIFGNFGLSFVIGIVASLIGGYGSGFLGFGGDGGGGDE